VPTRVKAKLRPGTVHASCGAVQVLDALVAKLLAALTVLAMAGSVLVVLPSVGNRPGLGLALFVLFIRPLGCSTD
jgi:hypothetical protein